MTTLYDQFSEERKQLQESGECPLFYTTGGYQMIKTKYLLDNETPKGMYERLAKTAAKHLPDSKKWEERFFEVMWKGWLSPATPVLTNMGTTRGTPVSCSGGYVGDNVYDFYDCQKEVAVLSQNGFGTSSYLGDIRPRGADISRGGKASGVLPVIKDFVQVSRDITQGSNRRGAWAGYIEIDHKDFYEVAEYLYNNPDDLNIGWVITDAFIDRLNNGDKDAIERYQKMMKIRAVTGKGYHFYRDKVNRQNPAMYKDLGLEVKASQLCNEIHLHSSKDYTYTCVLSSMNVSKYDEWKDTDAVFVSTVFLDCVAEEFIKFGKSIRGLEKAVDFTVKSRALGLGVLGYATYLQDNMIPFESFEARVFNKKLFKYISEETLRASKWMAETLGEPEWCKGYGVRNTHTMAVAPTMSTSLICGGVSQGIEPIVANVYNQNSAGGEISRINPSLLRLMKERSIFNKKAMDEVKANFGSVQNVNWLSDEEKEVFKTAYEIDQMAIIKQASDRQRFIDQGQSLNLFFSAEESEEYVSKVTKEAMLDPYIKGLYYQRSLAGVRASTGECTVCEA
jgi:ribonucleoside-diphosphate reductase alpha chain